MESPKTRKSAIVVIAVLCGLVALLLWAFFPRDKKEPATTQTEAPRTVTPLPELSRLVGSDLPILDLRLRFVTTKGEDIPAEETKLGRAEETGEAADGSCPELLGGDTGDRTLKSEAGKRGENCAKIANWTVKRHPVGLSLYFQDGKKVLALFDDKTMVSELFRNRFFQGLFYEPLRDAGIRAEDLRLEGLQGAFLKTVIREAVAADGELHYDIAHGKRGFVFSFAGEKCAYFTKALPVMAKILARSGYRVSALPEPILEMRVGMQRLFLTQVEGRIYLANGLEALLNVLESLPAVPDHLPGTPLVLAVRSEAFLTNILSVVAGAPEWELRLGFGLSGKNADVLEFPAGRFTGPLSAKVYKGVAASIPRDVFGALVTSYHLPPGMPVEEWRRLVTDGPQTPPADTPPEAGVAIIWDLDAETEGISQLGVVIANQQTPHAAGSFKKYFRDRGLTAECGGGAVFLAATSEKLLLRMKESCGGQSLSMLDWENGKHAGTVGSSQLFAFLNGGSGMRELFLAGGAAEGDETGEFAPQWKKEYEEAKAAMRREGEKVFGVLPIFAYAGTASPTAKVVELKGFRVEQGGAR